MSSNKVYYTQFNETETGDIILEFPDEVLERMDWKEGDLLEFEVGDNSIRISKVEEGAGDS